MALLVDHAIPPGTEGRGGPARHRADPTTAGYAGVIPAFPHHDLRTWFEANGTGLASALGDPAVAAALAAIHQDPAQPWTVASLAAVAGLSRAPSAKRFTDLTGQCGERGVA